MAKTETKKNHLPLFITAGVLVCGAIAATIFGASANKTDTAPEKTANIQTVGQGDNLLIPTSDVGETAQFYPVEIDGTKMEVLAIRDSAGNIRTAFNTCQSCYSSGRGYYVAQGTDLICQNCGSRFTAEQVETEAGGCNPYPIFENSKTSTDDSIAISYDFLKQYQVLFSNWK